MTAGVLVPVAQQQDGAPLAALLARRPELAAVGVRPYLVQSVVSA